MDDEKKESKLHEMYVIARQLNTFEPWQAWALVSIFIFCGLLMLGELIYIMVTT